MTNPVYQADAISALAKAKAHFVLAHADKAAAEKEWQVHLPPLDKVLDWVKRDGNLLGFKPTSLGLVVVDLDAPDVLDSAIVEELLGPALAVIPSSKPGRLHFYYRKPGVRVTNRKWADPETLRLGGEFRCSNGYAILWDAPSVAELLDKIDDAEPAQLDKLPPWSKRAEEVRNAPEGARNDTLFRESFGAKANGATSDDLINAAVAAGLSPHEAKRTVESAASGANKAALDHVMKLHSLTPIGFALRLLDDKADQLLLAKYIDRQQDERTVTFLLQETGLWRRDRDALHHHVDRLVDAEVVKQYRDGDLRERKVLEQTLKMRNATAEVVNRLGQGWHRWRESNHARLGEVERCDLTDLDRDGRYLGCANGVIDLKTGERLDPAAARRHRVSQSTNVAFHPGKTHKLLEQLTAHLPEETEEYVWALLGRTMWGQPIKAGIFVIGPTGSGKSTLAMSVKRALGEEADGCKADIFAKPRSDGRDGPNPARAALALKRAVFALEAEGWLIDNEAFKNATGQEDDVTYEMKFGPILSRPLRAQVWFFANEMPQMQWHLEPTVNRIIVIPYPAPREINNAFEGVTKNPDYQEAVLAKLVRYAAANPPPDAPSMPDTVKQEHKRRIDRARGPFGVWMGENLLRDPNGVLPKTALWAAWCAHCGVNPEQASVGDVKDGSLATHVRKLYALDATTVYDPSQKKGVYGWRGVRLKDPVEQGRLDSCTARLWDGATCGQPLNPNPPKGCGHADVVRDESGMNGWCGFDPYGFDRVWALEAHQWEVDDPGWR